MAMSYENNLELLTWLESAGVNGYFITLVENALVKQNNAYVRKHKVLEAEFKADILYKPLDSDESKKYMLVTEDINNGELSLVLKEHVIDNYYSYVSTVYDWEIGITLFDYAKSWLDANTISVNNSVYVTHDKPVSIR